ncbi:hypothetical protein TWF696_001977 [Orbilia brochopaga]|uniref:UBC core domain-containing protein n=1 Tax=Orbilia brochopaga TaxID=3140254 RepID=A0AAV9UAW6_9PEZI
MPRDQYDTDLYMASDDDFIEGVFVVGTGENEGEFLFQYHPLSGESPSMISAIIVDLGRYPTGHEVFIFGCGEDAVEVGEKLGDLPTLQGKTVKQILTTVSTHLRAKEGDGSKKRPFIVSDDDDGDSRDVSMLDDSPTLPPTGKARRPSPMLIDDFGDDLYSLPGSPAVDKGKKPVVKAIPPNRLVSDLRTAKDAGFKVGYHGSLKGTGVCYLIVSCRLSRLGLSDNALDAWHVETKRYLNLIIEYPSGYANLEEIFDGKKGFRGQPKKINIRMRIRQGDKYKPSKYECQAMFKRGDSSKDMPYIFRSLEMMLNERLVDLLRKRWDSGYSWYGAEEMYHDKSQKYKSVDAMPATFWHDDSQLGGFSRLVTSDHFQDSDNPLARSFPLIAMQFFLRHFARYTDFCLVCHRRVTSDVEALEPYVCSTPECLHKYLSSDFGPGIERDIVEQPYVVDLLVSFCYAAAKHQKLKDFPDALNLKVPYPAGAGPAGYSGTFDRTNKELTLRINAANPISHPVQVGTWMTINGAGAHGETLCCRAVDMSMFPIIRVSDPISTVAQANALNIGNTYIGGSVAAAGSQQVTVDLFNKDFATLTPQAKQLCICLLLDTLPSVREMKDRLRQQHLSSWGDRISPAALGVLRWVVASNRACIVQVDGLESGSNGVFPATQAEDRVYGMGNWMQFRFAMGAPDKEQRFQSATAAAQRRLRLKYSTLFAWHGSPLVNWHSIIREGLNFNQTLNGRAYGNGCYHSLDFRTSSGYTGRHSIAGEQWSKSVLKVSSAVALNEIVNAPNEYVSRTPHLVVAQLDWIQTRYLFVQCAFSSQNNARQKQPTQVKPQDPSMTPNGEQGKIIIPQPKAARARKDDLLAESSKGKKNEQYVTVVIDGIEERIPVEEDPGSDRTNDSDLDVFFEGASDSLEVNDLDVAIALSMEETLTDSSIVLPPQAPVRRKTSSGWFSAFGGVRGNIKPLEAYQRQQQPPPLSVPTTSATGASSSSAAAAASSSAPPAVVPPVAAASSASTSAAAVSASPTTAASASPASPLPSYDEIPLTSTPPTYTPVVDLTGGSSAASSSNPYTTPDAPRWFRNNSTASSSSVSTNQSPPMTTASSATSISSSRGSPGGFFDGIRKTFSNIGSSSTASDPWNAAFSALPSTNPFSGASKKGKAPASRPVISAPILTQPAPRALSTPAPAVSSPVVQPPVVKAAPPPAPAPVASTSTAPPPAPVVATPTPAPAPAKPQGPLTDFVAGELDYSTLPLIAQPTFATHAATKRLQREYKNLLKIQESTPLHELGWYTNPDHFDNVYQWIVELHTFDSALPLAKDMKSRGVKSVVLELRFGASFPTTPPFVRVIKPRFLPFMNGGGGHVTVGGAVCLEMLTGTGWDAKTTIESVLLNVRLAMMSTDPRPAKLEHGGGGGTYGVGEAVQAYLRACRTHGWAVPKGFEEMARATR